MGISFNWFKGRFFQNKTLEQLWAVKSVSPEEFTQLYVSLLKEMAPDSAVEVIAPLELKISLSGDEKTLTSYLDNAYKECQCTSQDKKETCASYIHSFIESMAINIDSRAIDPNKIIPVIKDKRYIHNVPSNDNAEKPIIYENLVADIYVAYAVDDEYSIRFLQPSEFREMNMSFEHIRMLAVDNLQNILPQAKLLKHDTGYIVQTDGQNEAAILLFDSFWEQIEQKIRGQIVAAVPSRNVLLFTTRQTKGGIAGLREFARKVSENESYLISETLLIRQNGKWDIFREPEGNNEAQ